MFVAACVILAPAEMSWACIAMFIAFEAWLQHRMPSPASDPVPAGEAPYHFSEEEARVVGRYRFYFRTPEIARASGSVLAALGLTSLLLAPWLTYQHLFVQAVLVGGNLFAVARLTRLVSPVYALRLSAARGNRDALGMLEAHDAAWVKIRAANQAHG